MGKKKVSDLESEKTALEARVKASETGEAQPQPMVTETSKEDSEGVTEAAAESTPAPVETVQEAAEESAASAKPQEEEKPAESDKDAGAPAEAMETETTDAAKEGDTEAKAPESGEAPPPSE